jgi:hypothetical protein
MGPDDSIWVVPLDRSELPALLDVLERVTDTQRRVRRHDDLPRTERLRDRLAEMVKAWQGGPLSFTSEDVDVLVLAITPTLRSAERLAKSSPTEPGMPSVGIDSAHRAAFASHAVSLRALADKILGCNPSKQPRGGEGA